MNDNIQYYIQAKKYVFFVKIQLQLFHSIRLYSSFGYWSSVSESNI